MAPFSGLRAFQTRGSSFDTVLGLRTATFNAATGALTCTTAPLAANNDISGSNKQSSLTYAVTGGTLYCITVDGFGTNSSSYGTGLLDVR
jgi:hypothetical protein